MDFAEICKLLEPLWADIKPERQFHKKLPLLAHYTTLATLEKMLTSNEVWFSNPLFMNDLEEIRYGILNGVALMREHQGIRAALSIGGQHQLFTRQLDGLLERFGTEHLYDTYVFCTTEHDPNDTDGLLSQWRAYGANGNGAALVLDTSKFTQKPGSGPLVLAEVHYGTHQQRLNWLREKADMVATILSTTPVPIESTTFLALGLFERIKLFALFSKHIGFAEEREWRFVYLRDRDAEKKYDFMFSYHNGPRGIEPKLKFPIRAVPGVTADDLSFQKLTASIILGPTTSSPLALAAVKRMLTEANKSELVPLLRASSIPLRPA